MSISDPLCRYAVHSCLPVYVSATRPALCIGRPYDEDDDDDDDDDESNTNDNDDGGGGGGGSGVPW